MCERSNKGVCLNLSNLVLRLGGDAGGDGAASNHLTLGATANVFVATNGRLAVCLQCPQRRRALAALQCFWRHRCALFISSQTKPCFTSVAVHGKSVPGVLDMYVVLSPTV